MAIVPNVGKCGPVWGAGSFSEYPPFPMPGKHRVPPAGYAGLYQGMPSGVPVAVAVAYGLCLQALRVAADAAFNLTKKFRHV